jgi:hypothetical protein
VPTKRARRKRLKRVPPIVMDFWIGDSILGLARKYGMRVAEVEEAIRKWIWDGNYRAGERCHRHADCEAPMNQVRFVESPPRRTRKGKK